MKKEDSRNLDQIGCLVQLNATPCRACYRQQLVSQMCWPWPDLAAGELALFAEPVAELFVASTAVSGQKQ